MRRDAIAARPNGTILVRVRDVVYRLRLVDAKRALWQVTRADGEDVDWPHHLHVIRRAEHLAAMEMERR